MSADNFKILITDDDVDLRELLTEAVKNWGYTVSVAKEGEEALRKLRMERYDIVITDLMMPGMDGLALLKKIKELDREILVIIITGYATIETAVKAIESGAYDYIAKPFRLDELMIVIKNACERLRLTLQNKGLLDELRTAYGEIAVLKNALAQVNGNIAQSTGEQSSALDRSMIAHPKEGLSPQKQQEYLKEADRFIRTKPLLKTT
ncbi:MAG: sigma-54-dependent Fis family transcriptional regulator [Deltaproteobacteria bacterium]|nr:sigma-54-dependent Fis family transcriptional regulator [Deltaproteobacteria bacterium]